MKAVVLLSGGLDSSLALKMIHDQGIDVLALHFSSPFCRCDGSKGCGSAAKSVSDLVGVELKNVHLSDEYLEMVKDPKHGRGKNMNPCLDCRIMKFSHAKKVMEEIGASFIVTGEVLGQRPMSQHGRAMALIEKETGLKDRVVRPLSAQILEPTLPEREGWVDAEAFLSMHGRNRTPQIQLAEELGIIDYPCPAGGCLLTDPLFSKRINDLLERGSFDINNVELLKLGRHLRLSDEFKLIVGRNESENNMINVLSKKDDIIFEPTVLAGPTALGRGKASKEIEETCCRIVARYTDPDGGEVDVFVRRVPETEAETVTCVKLDDLTIKNSMV